jgi:nickel/cobalt exporter
MLHAHDLTHQTSLWISLLLGALHALEPGHGKSAFVTHLVTTGQSRWRPIQLALVTTFTHAFSILTISFLVHGLLFSAVGLSQDSIASGLGQLSAVILLLLAVHTAVEYWRHQRDRSQHQGSTPDLANPCDCPSHRLKSKLVERMVPKGQVRFNIVGGFRLTAPSTSAELVSAPWMGDLRTIKSSKSGLRTLVVGIAVGLIPCPSALAALSTALISGDYFSIFTVIMMFSIGIFVTLCTLGLLAVKLLSHLKLSHRIGWRFHYAYLLRFVAFAGTGLWHAIHSHA